MKILLTCAEGISTSMMASLIEKEAVSIGDTVEVWAVGIDDVKQEVTKKQVDMILVAPQVKFALNDIQKIADNYDIPLVTISSIDYGRMDAKKIYNNIKNI